jgi:phage head maturation protease
VERKKGADGKDDVIIRHKSFEFLSALTIGMDPAYKQTSVNARELDKQTPEGKKEEEERQERERREKAEQDAIRAAAMRRAQIIDNEISNDIF